MKIFFILFVPYILFAAPPIVFVQLGPRLPDYLTIAISQARLFNPDSPIYLLGHQRALKTLPRSFLSSSKTRLVSVESLEKDFFHNLFITTSKLDRTYREGFWTYTTERFFFLHDFIKKNNLTDVFHLESDVMLYTNVDSLLSIARAHYPNMIAIPSDSDSRCIASIMYIANAEPLNALTKFIVDRLRSIDNDMHFLAHFRHNFFQIHIDHLPVIMPQYAAEHPLISRYGDTTETPERYTNYFDDFQSIFDAAAIGQYLGGIDPRNGESKPGFVNETTLFNVADFRYEWIRDEQNRLIPYLIYNNQKIKINNLHIHAKNLASFKS